MKDSKAHLKKFDYIVVGAGSAGCVLANRLSADGKHSVLLVEAGGTDWNPLIHMPAGLAKLVGIKSINWGYNTAPEPHLNNRRLYWPRGKVLGGSSSINAMCYCRGHLKDYDLWQSLGNEGWGSKDVLPYFLKSENNQRLNNEFHHQGGLLSVSDHKYTNPLSGVFLDAAAEVGYDLTDDFNGLHQRGFGYYQLTQKDGQRHSTAEAFLKPAKKRDNLTVWTKTLARKVLLKDKKAIGLQVNKSGEVINISANKEIILSGGAINSPQLLMLSGIGVASELAQHDIACQHELPGVGKNLQDHLDVCLVQHCSQKITYDTISEVLSGLKYVLFKQGPATSNVAEAGGFWQSPLSKDDRPDMQFHFVPAMLDDHGRNRLKGSGYTLHMCVLRPQSRGQITLNSSDPTEHPLIQANYLSHEHDLKLMIEGFKIQRKIFAAKAFDEYRSDEVFPGSDTQSDDQIIDFIRNKSESIYHPIGTCKMGIDEMAVVDHNLKVHGIEGLRVIDASVMPTLVSGNTNAPTIMMAEKISDVIVKTHS